MDKRKAPLRNVIREWYVANDFTQVELECGHIIVTPQDIAGYYNAKRRRCWKCAKEITKKTPK